MEICFAGTGAADWNWSKPLTKESRGSTCTLLDNRLLIDAGSTVWESLKRTQKNPAEVTVLLINHTHSDHFNLEQIAGIANAPRRKTPLQIYLSPQGMKKTTSLKAESHAFSFGQELLLGNNLKAQILPANHLLSDPAEAAYYFLFTLPDGKRLLYALDGAWMISYAKMLIGSEHLDMIVWDATSGSCYNDWRFADHNDLNMIDNMRGGNGTINNIDNTTKHVFNHIARTLWPESAAERETLVQQHHGILAQDGMTLEI